MFVQHAREHAASRLQQLDPLPGSGMHAQGTNLPLVLVAEDNDDNRLIAISILRHGGFAVCEAVDGVEALEVARRLLPSLIVMDVEMPGLDGWSVTRALKAETATRDIVVVVVSAHALPDDQRRAAEAGCDRYLTKPISPSALLATVREALGVHGG